MSTLTHPLQHISGKDQTDTLEDHEGIVSIGRRTKNKFRFADVDGLAGEQDELAKPILKKKTKTKNNNIFLNTNSSVGVFTRTSHFA